MSATDALTAAATPTEIATSIATALEALATAVAESATAVADEAQNGTLPLGLDGSDVTQSTGNYVVLPATVLASAVQTFGVWSQLNTIVGLLIVLGASVLNAFGLNLTKLDHLQNSAIPKAQRKKEYLRPLWLGGMGIYILSQVLGSPLALRYLRPDWVAPLGASSLIFNFVFAYFLVGTPVTTSDIRGTALIVLGVILILVFSSINHGLRDSLSIDELSELWRRPSWLSYFFFLTAATFGVYLISDVLAKVSKNRASLDSLPSPELPTTRFGRASPGANGSAIKEYWGKGKWIFKYARGKYQHYENIILRHMEAMLSRTSESRVQWFEGIGWAVCGGSLAGLCIIFTKAVVKITWLPGHPLLHFVSIITILFLIITAVSQIVCLNRALKCADTVTVVPLFYAGYTVFGAINALIFYDQTGAYATWTLVCVFLSIAVLISGVVLLSMKRADEDVESQGPQTTTTVDADPAVRLHPRQPTDGGENGGVLWTVGEDDEDSDDEDKKDGPGVGGTNTEGERGGLLLVHDEDERLHSPARRASRRLEDEEEAEFGPFASPMRSPRSLK